ncbi:MAG: patatin-like phospholipase family protein [Treponema sp.]|nr:patatin-like phospholipase family protein [Treponema sp.]
MEKLGLVLAGGGGRGAYQLGVWKYLVEKGISDRISVVSGTSVGAMNAVLFDTTSFKTAEEIWTRYVYNTVLRMNLPVQRTIPSLAQSLLFRRPLRTLGPNLLGTALKIGMNGICSRAGLIQIMNSIPMGTIQNSKRSLYATSYEILPNRGIRYFHLNANNPASIKKILLASSAIPFAFRPEYVGGRLCYDGGIACNIPTAPLVREGCSTAIIVKLSPSTNTYKSRRKTNKISGMKSIVISPSQSIGGIAGTFNFSPSYVRNLINLGYKDAFMKFKDIAL